MTLCLQCKGQIEADDAVVVAARQLEVMSQERGREYIDGPRVVFHEEHWYGDFAGLKERRRGRWADIGVGAAS